MIIIFKVLKKTRFSQVVPIGQDIIYKSFQIFVVKWYGVRAIVQHKKT